MRAGYGATSDRHTRHNSRTPRTRLPLTCGTRLHTRTPQTDFPRVPRRGFSLIELVIVIVILGVIAAIAIPRLGSSAQHAKDATVRASLRELTVALDIYTTKNEGRDPSIAPNGSFDTDSDAFTARLLADGYLKAIPYNPYTRKACMRLTNIENPTAECAWRYNPQTHQFLDDTP